MGAGDFDAALLPKSSAGDLLIAADGGLDALRAGGFEPDICVGDFDSLGRLPDGADYIKLPVEKDDTDLIAAARLGLSRGYTEFEFYGALGGRRFSHSLAAVETLLWLLDSGAEGEIIDVRCRVSALRGGRRVFPAGTKGLVSVFAAEESEVTLRGLYYPLDRYPLSPRFPLGVSNRFTGGEAVIEVKGCVIIVTEEEL